MKKLLLILTALPLIFISCEDSNQAPSNSGNNSSSFNTYDWYFEIKVDGISNRIEGTFNDSSYFQLVGFTTLPNRGFISLGNPNLISAVLSNKGENTYISGESFSVGINVANLNLGMNNSDLNESADMFESFIGHSSEEGGTCIEEHRAIYTAIMAGDADKAREANTRLLNNSNHRLPTSN